MQNNLYPRYLGYQLHPELSQCTIVGLLNKVDINSNTIILQLDPDNVGKQSIIISIHEDIDINLFNDMKFIQIRGEYMGTKNVKMHSYTNFNANFDLNSYNQMLGFATKQFKELFNY